MCLSDCAETSLAHFPTLREGKMEKDVGKCYPGCQRFSSQSDGIGEEKPLVQAVENLSSMPRLIDIDITYQLASSVPTVHSSYLLRCQIQKFNVSYKTSMSNLKIKTQIPKLNFGGHIRKSK